MRLSLPFLAVSTFLLLHPVFAAVDPAKEKEAGNLIERSNAEVIRWAAEVKEAPTKSDRYATALMNLAVARSTRAGALEVQERWAEAEMDWDGAERYSREHNTVTQSEAMSPVLYLRRRAGAEYKQGKFAQCLQTLNLAATRPRWKEVQQEATILLVRTNLQLENFEQALANANLALDIITKARAYINTPTAYVADEITTLRLGAVAHYLRGDLSAAMEKWKKAAAIAQMDAGTHFFDANQVKFNQQVATNPTDPQIRLARARYFVGRGEFKAEKTYATSDFLDGVIKDGKLNPAGGGQAPRNQGGLRNLIDLDTPTAASFYEAAIYDLEKALGLSQQANSPMTALAPIHLELGAARVAFNETAPKPQRFSPSLIIKDFEDAGRAAPKSPDVQRQIGDFYRDRAIEVKPNDSTDWQQRKSNLARAAIGAYSKAVYLAPNGAGNAELVAMANKLTPWVAEGKLENVPRSEPKTALEWKERGNLYNEANDWRKAIGAYEQSLKIDPKFADSYNNLGVILLRIKRYDLALSMFNKGLQSAPRHRIIYFNRAKLWNELTEREKAIEDATKAFEFAETPAARQEALTLRADIYHDANDFPKALSDAVAATQLESGNKVSSVPAWTLRGDLELRNHDLSAADASLAKAIELSPQQGRSLLLRGLIAHVQSSTPSSTLGPEAQAHLNGAKPHLVSADLPWLRRYITNFLSTPAFKEDSPRLEGYYRAALNN